MLAQKLLVFSSKPASRQLGPRARRTVPDGPGRISRSHRKTGRTCEPRLPRLTPLPGFSILCTARGRDLYALMAQSPELTVLFD
jgi:hypothetical protein